MNHRENPTPALLTEGLFDFLRKRKVHPKEKESVRDSLARSGVQITVGDRVTILPESEVILRGLGWWTKEMSECIGHDGTVDAVTLDGKKPQYWVHMNLLKHRRDKGSYRSDLWAYTDGCLERIGPLPDPHFSPEDEEDEEVVRA